MSSSSPIAVDVVVDTHASDGAYALLEIRAVAGATVPRHVGAQEDAIVHVLAGAVAIRVDRTERVLRAGDHAVMTRGLPRDARVLEDARILLLFVPAGAERIALLAQEADADADDLAALLAAAGFTRLPALPPEPAAA